MTSKKSRRISGKLSRKKGPSAKRDEKGLGLGPPVTAQTKKSADPVESASRSPKDGARKHFPIVGVGASAGGLEAFTELLQDLPVDTDMAFVLVQHLDPDHESALTQILLKTTSMPVSEITQGMAVAPNRIYVIPRNTNLTIARGVLKLEPRKKTAQPHRSIDFFFESLAQDQQEWAIGVVLSGTATDGTQGLEMIKSEGGITFAQDDSAKYDSMPRSAVDAGCVDLVLSPKEIAHELARIAKHPLVAARRTSSADRLPTLSEFPRREDEASGNDDELKPRHPAEDKAFNEILLLLRKRRGVDFSLYKPNTLQRRVARRMLLNKKSTLHDYAHLLNGNPKELDLLYSDVLISVTSFFRNPEAFDVLKSKVFPELLGRERRDDPVRVWTLGCSTGQEAYSIGMAFTEFCDKIAGAPKLQVFATDLNELMLEKARHGLYAKTLVANISPERLRRFFIEEQGGYRVSKALRELCVFARQNVLGDPPFSRMDLISCRNLLIYIEPELQKRILPNFYYALKPGGFLFLGASESIGAFTNLFTPVDKRYKVFAKKPGQASAYHLPITEGIPAMKKGNAAKNELPADDFRADVKAQREADRVTINQFAPPGVLVNADLQILDFRGSTGTYLKPAPGKPSFDLLKMACEGLMLPLRAAVNKAKKEDRTVLKENVRLESGGHKRLVNIEVIPLKNLKKRCYLIFFEEVSKAGANARDLRSKPWNKAEKATLPETKNESRRVTELERELAEAHDYTQSLQDQHEAANEELQASHEEVQSANEELQSINEELETSKEELESTNEELTTVNEEMANRNTELGRLNSDLTNLQSSTRLPIVLLGRDLTVRRFSPQAEKLFNLTSADLGRPFGHIRHNLDLPGLDTLITNVIASVRESETEVRDKQGRWHLVNVRPYITLDNKVDGAVLVLVDINAIKESEQAIAAARDFAEAIIRTARDPLLILSSDMRVELANEAFYSTFKVSPTESVGRSVFELDHGRWDSPKLRELLQDILPRHSVFNNFEVTTDFENIGRRTIVLNARALNETGGRPARILLGIQDMSDRLHFEAEMRRSELRYRRLFEAAKDGVLIVDPDSRKILDANPFMTELLGYPHADLVGKELFEIGLLSDEAASRAAFRTLKAKGFVRYENLPLQTKNGKRREVEFVSNLYKEDGGNVIQCNIRDVTERKQVEQELSEKARLLDLSNDAIIVRNLDDMISLWNKGAEKLYGWTCEEVIGKHLHTLLQTEFPKPIDEIVEQLYQEGQYSDEVVQIARDGRRIPSLCRWVLDQETGSILTSYTDITERKVAEDALRRAKDQLADRAGQLEHMVAKRTEELTATNKQLESFVYSIAHDLRAPLRSMQGFSSMLIEEAGASLSDAGKDFAGRIAKSAHFMDDLLIGLLSFSRTSHERVELAPVNLGSCVDSVLSQLQKEIQEMNARVESPGPWPSVLAHGPTLMQVLFNLTSNALKFAKPTAPLQVRLRTEERGEFIRVWVEDNGIGIAPEHHEEVFRLFNRLHGEKYPGTGIGLAIVQKGIERMGGQAGVKSVPGQGSCFWFELRKA